MISNYVHRFFEVRWDETAVPVLVNDNYFFVLSEVKVNKRNYWINYLLLTVGEKIRRIPLLKRRIVGDGFQDILTNVQEYKSISFIAEVPFINFWTLTLMSLRIFDS